MRPCTHKFLQPVLLALLIVVLSGTIALAADPHGGSLSAEKLKDLFWRTVNFLALVVILVKFGAKPIMSGLSGRDRKSVV